MSLPPVSSRPVSPIDAFVAGARREDLETLAAAALRIAAEMFAAQDWDSGADWLARIAQTATIALANLVEPGDLPGNSADSTDFDDEDAVAFAWRRWLGSDAEAWRDTFDPAAPETWTGTYEGWQASVDQPALLRECVEGLDERQRVVFLLAMGCGEDDWHDADLTDPDRAEQAVHALQQARNHD
ncbi:MAG: hypothetical protein L0G49_13170 [Luteococcus sp.]|uniref:hypothetical protein n=1 Tax=Luteococcus sp. TaxID=1969402 RepID=UPI0026495ED0|nr:hypothetical protein [Luteococcus sp.]MDN5564695.1 hypothetical protein [Luteococcus sp.]